MSVRALALSLLTASTTVQAVLEVSVQRGRNGQVSQPRRRSLGRRDDSGGTYIETLVNNVTGGGYYASVTAGTPPQEQTLIVDTGSSDVWLVAADADLCQSEMLQMAYDNYCEQTFNASASSTYKVIEEGGFAISYVDGSDADGDYISDTFSIGGADIKSLQMGYATSTEIGTGIMGIGSNTTEAAETIYPNLIDQFVNEGLIQYKAYSLYLNDYRSDTGGLLFGGIDTDKFIGDMSVLDFATLPGLNTINSSYILLAVNLTGLSGAVGSDTTTLSVDDPLLSILDSGTTLSYLPDALAYPLFDAVGAYTDNVTTGYTFVDCDKSTDLTVTYTFGGKATITVPASQIVLDLFTGANAAYIPSNVPFDHACVFGIQAMGDSAEEDDDDDDEEASVKYALLGDTFLRSAYVVYDLQNSQIGMAPANLNSTTSSIVELQAGATGLPTVSGVASQQTTSTGSSTSSSSSSSSKSAAGPSSHGPGLDAMVVAGIAGLFACLGGALLV